MRWGLSLDEVLQCTAVGKFEERIVTFFVHIAAVEPDNVCFVQPRTLDVSESINFGIV